MVIDTHIINFSRCEWTYISNIHKIEVSYFATMSIVDDPKLPGDSEEVPISK